MAEFYATKACQEIAAVVEGAVYDMFRERAYFYRRHLVDSDNLTNESIASSPVCGFIAPFVMHVLQQDLDLQAQDMVTANDGMHRFTIIDDGNERIVDATYKQFILPNASRAMPNVLVATRQHALTILPPILKADFKPTFYDTPLLD